MADGLDAVVPAEIEHAVEARVQRNASAVFLVDAERVELVAG